MQRELLFALTLAGCHAADPPRASRPAPSDSTPAPSRASDGGTAVRRMLEIAPGISDYCALYEDGEVICEDPCNRRRRRELGGARHLAYSGGVACAIVEAGAVECWMPLATEPERIAGVTSATRMSVGRPEGCALLADGSARCWSITEPEPSSAIGFPRRPIEPRVRDLVHLDLGVDRACFVTRSGEVWCRGPGDREVSRVGGISDARRVAVSSKLSCAARRSGELACWEGSSGTVQTYRGLGALEIGAGLAQICALDASGRVRCFEQGGPPLNVTLLRPSTTLAVGWMASCVLREDGTPRCWGGFCDVCGDALEICAAANP